MRFFNKATTNDAKHSTYPKREKPLPCAPRDSSLSDTTYNLGICYANGQGVAKDEVEAVKWYRKAAEQNNALAQLTLGWYYQHGRGTAADYAEAVKWYRKAAEQNNAIAQNDLGVCYSGGQGVEKDEVEAVSWYRMAAEQNNADAQYNLGERYYKGVGVTKDYLEAYRWSLLASAQGQEDAKSNVSLLENKMSREQIAEGQKLARDFKPHASIMITIPSKPSPQVATASPQEARPKSPGTGIPSARTRPLLKALQQTQSSYEATAGAEYPGMLSALKTSGGNATAAMYRLGSMMQKNYKSEIEASVKSLATASKLFQELSKRTGCPNELKADFRAYSDIIERNRIFFTTTETLSLFHGWFNDYSEMDSLYQRIVDGVSKFDAR